MLFPEGASFASTEGPREAQALKKKKEQWKVPWFINGHVILRRHA